MPESSQRTKKWQQVAKISNKFQCNYKEPTKSASDDEANSCGDGDNHDSDESD